MKLQVILLAVLSLISAHANSSQIKTFIHKNGYQISYSDKLWRQPNPDVCCLDEPITEANTIEINPKSKEFDSIIGISSFPYESGNVKTTKSSQDRVYSNMSRYDKSVVFKKKSVNGIRTVIHIVRLSSQQVRWEFSFFCPKNVITVRFLQNIATDSLKESDIKMPTYYQDVIDTFRCLDNPQ